MRIDRLSWAGIRVTVGETVTVIDALGDAVPLEPFMGAPHEAIAPVGQSIDAAMVTHVHPDHYDPRTMAASLATDGVVVCPPSMTERTAEDGLRAMGVGPDDSIELGPLEIRALPAVDGLGEEQVSWVVSGDGKRIVHCGDTLWHGYWWAIAEHGPFDVAFLPINGAMVVYPSQTGIPASLTPEQAAAAAEILPAAITSPIHYGTFDFPPAYAEHPDAEAAFLRSAKERGVETRVLGAGETIELG